MKFYRFVMYILLVVGIGFLVYPTVSSFIADYTSTKVIIDFDKQIENMRKEELANQKKQFEEFNKTVQEVDITQVLDALKKNHTENVKEETTSTKDIPLREIKTVYKSGEMLGYITIDKIDVQLPLYEGTYEAILQKGVGHLETSSLPVGGKGTHAVFTGHSGLASAYIFDDLDLLDIGDTFFIKFLDETLLYEVDNITIVEPDKADPYISIDPDNDFVTLITCTPKTVNTHRLLIRGKRIPYDEKNAGKNISEKIKQKFESETNEYCLICVGIIVFIILILAIIRKKKFVFTN